ncbi:hypothetical protein [Bradyrhizobium cytisi]|nr:hypothetical protein [Bradyrhizobium cytisi]
MAAALIGFVVMALLAVVAGELPELPWRRRLADAGRSRLAARREKLRW